MPKTIAQLGRAATRLYNDLPSDCQVDCGKLVAKLAKNGRAIIARTARTQFSNEIDDDVAYNLIVAVRENSF